MLFPARGAKVRLVVMGPDGSGKSTVALGLVSSLQESGLRVRHQHFLPTVSDRPTTSVTDPHAKSPRRWTQLPAVLKRWAKYVGGQVGGGLSLRDVDVVVQERGWRDQLVDPARYRLSGAGVGLAKALGPLTPAVHGVILCSGDADEIAARKSELTVAETARQLSTMEVVTRGLPRVGISTTALNVEQSVAKARSFVDLTRQVRARRALRPVHPIPSRLNMLATAQSRPARRSLYRPASPAGVVASRVGLPAPWHTSSASSALVAEVLATLCSSFDGVASIRSHGRSRWVIALTSCGVVTEYIKVETGDDSSLRRERQVLDEMCGQRSLRVPEARAFVTADGWSALCLTPVERRPAIATDLELALDAACALRWSRDGHGVTHGDLTPWNLIQGEVPGLVDWEMSQTVFVPGADLAKYVVSSGLLALLDPGLVATTFGDYRRRCNLSDELDVSALLATAQQGDRA